MKRILLLLILSLFSMTFVYAYHFAVANDDGVVIYYDWNETNATVTYETTSYNSYSGNVVIPNEVVYNGTTYAVTSIGDRAFLNCSGLTSITFPNSVTAIGKYAFQDCSVLSSLTISNFVTAIGERAFSGCSALTGTLTIPNSVTAIGTAAFSDCSELKHIVLEDGNETLSFGTSYSHEAFANCPIESLYLGRNISYAYSNSVTGDNYSPFRDKTTLTSVIIGNLVTTIGKGAFSGCSGLESITVSNSVSSIEDYAFSTCNALTHIAIPNSVSSIGYETFYNCSSLKNIVLEDGTDNLFFTSTAHDSGAFGGCPIESLYIGRSISYYYSPFRYHTTLTSLTISSFVTSIGDSAFSDCSGLINVVIEDGTAPLTFYIPPTSSSPPFMYCPINNLYLGRNINPSTTPFRNTSTASITIGNLVTTIGAYAFLGCTKLVSISIPNSVTSIGSYAFSWCNRLTDVIIEDGTETLSWGNDFEYTNIQTLYLGRNVTYSASPSPFGNMTSLKELTVSNLVTSIESDAFYNCHSLMTINSKNPTPPQAYLTSFTNVDKEKCALFVPVGSFTPYSEHSVWKQFFNIQEKDFSSGTSINNIVSDTEILAYITDNGIKITGCSPFDNVSIYTVTGQIVYSSVIGDGFISYPFKKGTVYIIRTSKKSLKVVY